MSARSEKYQTQVTGRTGEAYVVDGVKFDGFVDGRLLETKGPGYSTFLKDGQFRDWFKGAEDLVSQAQRQVKAANGLPITWHVAESDAADAIRELLADRGILGITVVHTPPTP